MSPKKDDETKADEPTKADLQKAAAEAGIEGRSSMTKDELAEALEASDVVIKYMGTADRAEIPAGYDFGGRLATPVEKKVVWSWHENKHRVKQSEAGLSDAAVMLLLQDTTRFLDVTNLEVIPPSLWEKMHLAVPDLPGWESRESIPSDYQGAGLSDPPTTVPAHGGSTRSGSAT